MKASLSLNFRQSLTLTPQLQQAIRLLQLSTLELQQEIQENLEVNPMLELEEHEGEIHKEREYEDKQIEVSDIPNELPVDTKWDDIYPTTTTRQTKDDAPNFENFHSTTENLQDHLRWQMELTPFSELDVAIATTIIDAINDDGFLTCSLEDVLESLRLEDNTDEETRVNVADIEAVLHRIQRFDPVSVGSRDLSECLIIQLGQLEENTLWLKQAKKIVAQDIDLLGQRNYQQLMRKYKLSQEQLGEVLQLIQSMTPRPGASISDNKEEYVIPDVVVKKVNDRWRVELNPETVPKLRINNHYASLVERANDSPDNNYLRNNLQEARWFIKSLHSRNDTLLRTATCIVEHQQNFLEHGEEAMKPLVLSTIAEALELHESTISRVTTQKYMHTPRGVFELKYFFSSHVSTDTGGECSSTAIRALIKKLVAAENPNKPLSDNKIAQLLGDQGINVARRTIAKYREALNIPPSNERKSILS